MPRTRNGSNKDFVSKDKEKRQNITQFGVWDQGSEKQQTSLVPSEHAVTLCEIST